MAIIDSFKSFKYSNVNLLVQGDSGGPPIIVVIYTNQTRKHSNRMPTSHLTTVHTSNLNVSMCVGRGGVSVQEGGLGLGWKGDPCPCTVRHVGGGGLPVQ